MDSITAIFFNGNLNITNVPKMRQNAREHLITTKIFLLLSIACISMKVSSVNLFSKLTIIYCSGRTLIFLSEADFICALSVWCLSLSRLFQVPSRCHQNKFYCNEFLLLQVLMQPFHSTHAHEH